MDRSVIPVPLLISTRSSAPRSSVQTLKKYLSEVEKEWTQSVITVRKILQDRPIECMMMGNLYRVKLLQFVELEINGTILIKASQDTMAIIKHSTTLFRGKLELKMELMEA